MDSIKFFKVNCCVLLFLLTACQNRDEKPPSTRTDETACTQINKEFATISAANDSPEIKAERLQSLYARTTGVCRQNITRPLLMALFRIVYSKPNAAPGISTYLRELSEKGTDEAVRLNAYFVRAAYYLYVAKRADSAIYCLDFVEKQKTTLNDTLLKSYHTLTAQVNYQKGDLPAAAKNYLKAIEYSEKIKDSVAIAGNTGNLGMVYSAMGDDKKAITLRKRTLDYFTIKGADASVFIGLVGMGASYENLKLTDSALYYYGKAVDLIKSGVKDPVNSLVLYINMGEIYTNQENYEKARYFFDLAKEPLQQVGNKNQEMSYTFFSMQAYAQIRDVTPEIKKTLAYIPILKKDNNLINLKEAYYFLYRVAVIKKDPVAALDYYKRFGDVRDELTNINNRKYIAELDAKYATAKKQVLIKQQQIEISEKKAINKFLVAVLIAVALTIAFFVNRYRLIKNKREIATQQHFTHRLLENTEEERGRIARDLHDGVSQELLLLKGQVKTHPADAAKSIDGIINEIRMISRELHPVMLSQIGLKQSVEHICNRIMESGKLFITADIDYPNPLSEKNELQLFRIIQEAINNLLKYSGAEAAKILIFKDGNNIVTEVIDNGKGFDVQSVLRGNTSFGLLSIVERSKSIGGKTDIYSASDGTKIKILIPIPHD